MDYILTDRQAYNDIEHTTIWDRLWVRSDHNILEMQIQTQANTPQYPSQATKQQTIRLKNPIARKRFKETITHKWDKIKDAHFCTVEDRYSCYVTTMHEALDATRNLPHIGERSLELIKLRQ